MRLLLTRSAEDAARTRDKLEAMGHRVIVSPVIETIGTGALWPPGVVDALLATSAQAFVVPIEGPPPETQRLLPLLLVGARTAEAAAAAGFLGPATIAANAAALAETIGGLAQRPRRLVYLAGRVRKPALEEALDAMGQSVEVVEVYDAQRCDGLAPNAIAALQNHAVDGVLHFSRRSAELFLATAAAGTDVDIGRCAHLCLSDDVAGPLRAAGCPTIRVASAANETSLLTLVADSARA